MNRKAICGILATVFFLASINIFGQNPELPPGAKRISGGVLNGKAISLPKPVYPAAARAVNARGSVNVKIAVNRNGDVISAEAVSGHPLLRSAAVEAARKAKFAPTILNGEKVEVSGIIVHNFQEPTDWKTLGTEIGFAEAKNDWSFISLLAGFEFDEKKLAELQNSTAENKRAALPVVIESIRGKLANSDLWYFDYGRTKAKILYADIKRLLHY